MQHYSIRDLLTLILQHKKQLVYANLIAVLSVAISIPIPLLIPLLVDEILLDKPGIVVETLSAFYHQAPIVFYVGTVLFAALFLRIAFFLAHIAQYRIFTVISKEIVFEMRKKLLYHIGGASASEFETLGSGNVNAYVVNDVNTVDEFIGVTAGKILVSVLMLIGVSVVLFSIHWGLALFLILLNPLIIMGGRKLAKTVGDLKKAENRAVEFFQESLGEVLDLYHHIRVNNRMKHYIDHTVERAEEIKSSAIAYGYKNEASGRLSFTIYLLGFEIFRAASILMVAYSDLSIGMMLAVFGYLWFMLGPVEEILSLQYKYASAKAALERINAILSLSSEPQYLHEKNPFTQGTCEIWVENLRFRYNEDKEVLKGISLEVPVGKKVALVGASGSGKTTLAQLLVGLYPLQEGMIHYGKVPVTQIGLECVRSNVFLVLQQPQLFNDTLLNNLTLGDAVPETLVWNALECAQLKSFVESLPEKLDTQVGRNGIRLSGGQRQRLAIARMVVAQPRIVIFDESTSALDMHTEERLYEAIEPFLEDKTVLIIAHRPSTIQKADYIYVMEEGEVTEEGDFETLIEREGGFLARRLHGKHPEEVH